MTIPAVPPRAKAPLRLADLDEVLARQLQRGLDGHHLAVLEMSGLFFLATQAASCSATAAACLALATLAKTPIVCPSAVVADW